MNVYGFKTFTLDSISQYDRLFDEQCIFIKYDSAVRERIKQNSTTIKLIEVKFVGKIQN